MTEFIGKIVHIILRSRYRKSTAIFPTVFAPPLVIDIIRKSNLVERWVLQEESFVEYEAYDSTELVLLCQTLFSFVNQMPTLADVDFYSISSLEGQVLASDSIKVGFDNNACLKVHKFKSARTNYGTLYLSVIYDTANNGSKEIGVSKQVLFLNSYSRKLPLHHHFLRHLS